MRGLCSLLISCMLCVILGGDARAQFADDSIHRSMFSFIGVFGGYHLLYGGASGVRYEDDHGYPRSVSVDNDDVFGRSPSAGGSIGVCASDFLLAVGFHYTSYDYQNPIESKDPYGQVTSLKPPLRNEPLYNLDLVLAYPLTDFYTSRVVPMLGVSLSSAGQESFFQESGRLFHFSVSGMAIVKLGQRPAGNNYFGLTPSVSYCLGRDKAILSSLFVGVGFAYFFPWNNR